MKQDSRELPAERLATTDETGKRVYLYPADVKGRFRRWRDYTQAVLLLIFLALPWIEVGGRQLLLFDIPNRRFSIFGLTFWAHDAPMMVFVLGGLVFGFAFVTAIWGRVWCGWGCPQTVFIDGVFRRIERWVEGDGVKRRRLDQQSWNLGKARKKSLKWFLFFMVSLLITHSFLAYFVGADRLMEMVQDRPSENPTSFLVILIGTGIVLFDFGWFREQFCIIACPYGRFQSVIMDEHSQVVAYDAARGEPRRGLVKAGEAQGDCVNCYRCVQVCPTGIDIRRGVQMECIACTACIDVCDEVMRRTKRPPGLIRYDSERGLEGKRNRPARARTVAYGLLLFLMAGGLIVTLSGRSQVEPTFIRAVGTPYQVVNQAGTGPQVINHYRVDFSNREFEPMEAGLEVADDQIEIVSANLPARLTPGEMTRIDVFFKFPKEALTEGKRMIRVRVTARPVDGSGSTVETVKEVPLVGPFN